MKCPHPTQAPISWGSRFDFCCYYTENTSLRAGSLFLFCRQAEALKVTVAGKLNCRVKQRASFCPIVDKLSSSFLDQTEMDLLAKKRSDFLVCERISKLASAVSVTVRQKIVQKPSLYFTHESFTKYIDLNRCLLSFLDFVDAASLSNESWVSRQNLQDLYQRLLVMDLEYALDRKVEQDLYVSDRILFSTS